MTIDNVRSRVNEEADKKNYGHWDTFLNDSEGEDLLVAVLDDLVRNHHIFADYQTRKKNSKRNKRKRTKNQETKKKTIQKELEFSSENDDEINNQTKRDLLFARKGFANCFICK